jgi:uracil-DNA glycosylase family 4
MISNELHLYLQAQLDLGTDEILIGSLPEPHLLLSDSPTDTAQIDTPALVSASHPQTITPIQQATPVLSTTSTPDFSELDSAKDLPEFHKICTNMIHSASKIPDLLLGSGSVNCRLMVIGSSPTDSDLKLQTHYAGAPGELLHKMLKAIKIEKNLCYITYLINHKVQKRLLARERSLYVRMIETEVRLVNPKAILILGEKPFQDMLKTGESLEQSGGLPFVFAGIPCYATHDPRLLNEASEHQVLLKKQSWKHLQALLTALN